MTADPFDSLPTEGAKSHARRRLAQLERFAADAAASTPPGIRDGLPIGDWLALSQGERLARIAAKLVTESTAHRDANAKRTPDAHLRRPAPAPQEAPAVTAEATSAGLSGWWAACACGCGNFQPARGPRPVVTYVAVWHRPRPPRKPKADRS